VDRRTYLKHTLALSGGLLIPAGVMSLVGKSGTTSSTELFGFDGRIMGTGYSVRLGSSDTKLLAISEPGTEPLSTRAKMISHDSSLLTGHHSNSLARSVHDELLKVDTRMSTWRETSELSHFNNSTNQNWQVISSETLSVIEKSLQLGRLSLGAFDLTVGPLVDLWGFGAASNSAYSATGFNKPSAGAVAKRMQYVDFNAIEIDLSRGVVKKQIPEAMLDLSGIAKGFAVDKVAEYLDAQGFENYLVEVGGELRSRGQRDTNQEWRVAIERPSRFMRDVLRVVNLRGRAIATSGDYRNFYVDGGQRYSHTIDPRNGYPVNHELVSVSVIADTTIMADAFSTALIIMGTDDAQTFAEQHGLAAHFVVRLASGKLEERISSEFTAYLA